MEKIMIAAVADDLAIGRDNALLWHISADMKYFRRTTMGCPVIMGFRTWESIGRPLPGRLNIVITRHHFDAPDTVLQVPDVASALAEAEKHLSAAG
ncbi:MAG: dihydrofolate reductase, partial [Candidatus Cryptobacteroides sp.]